MIEPTIAIDKLSKKYSGSDIFAIHNLTLNVYSGEVYGFLGPNGAGKSTTIRILMNFLSPTSGSAKILGKDIVAESVNIKNDIGYLSGDFAAYPKMTGRQYLDYLNDLRGTRNNNIKEMAKRLNADLNKKLGDLSRGNKQKIGLMQALMHNPKILILDEPTSGLDPLMQDEFYRIITEAKQRGTSIFVSSHILSEVQKMCDRVGIIREGKLVSESDINKLADQAAHTFDITFLGKVPISDIKKVNGVKVVSSNQNNITINFYGQLPPLLGLLSKHNVVRIDARNLDLESTFLQFYQEKKDRK